MYILIPEATPTFLQGNIVKSLIDKLKWNSKNNSSIPKKAREERRRRSRRKRRRRRTKNLGEQTENNNKLVDLIQAY